MSTTITLPATLRNVEHKPRDIRARSRVTAEVYGSGQKNLQIELDYHTFRRAFTQAGESTVIDLAIEGHGSALKVLVHSFQQDPITDLFTHIDFLIINMSKKVTTHVPLHFINESPAVKNFGGVFSVVNDSIEIRCLPADLPHALEVDISTLANLHDVVHVSDLTINRAKVEIFTAEDSVVCQVLAPKTSEQLEAELAAPVGDTLSEEARKAAEEEKAAAAASKTSDTEKKGER